MARLRAERRALLAALLCAAARACEDSHGDCPSWTAQGECTANPGSMHRLCPQSCGLCADIDANVPFGHGAAVVDEDHKAEL